MYKSAGGVRSRTNAKKINVRYFVRYFMHLGVVKVGLFWLAKLEVFCQRIIFKKKSSMKDKISSNFDKYRKRHLELQVHSGEFAIK